MKNCHKAPDWTYLWKKEGESVTRQKTFSIASNKIDGEKKIWDDLPQFQMIVEKTLKLKRNTYRLFL